MWLWCKESKIVNIKWYRGRLCDDDEEFVVIVNMPPLEGYVSTLLTIEVEQKGLKILTPQQLSNNLIKSL